MHVELRAIHKRFGTVHANAGISLSVQSGMIVGLLGENGAGKSTLMKILSGYLRPDSGTILLDGAPVPIHSPADAIRAGIGMLHQDPLDFPPMKLLDNVLLGRRGPFFADRRSAAREFTKLAGHFGFSLDPDAYADGLTVGERQQLEILRLLTLGARVLILDEPTTGISLPQKEKLFDTLRELASSGMSVLFVSHKLEDVELLCGGVAVLRRGELVGLVDPPYETRSLVTMMFGKELPQARRPTASAGERDSVLRLESLELEEGRLVIPPIELDVRRGEIVGLAGMEGSGQAQLLAACAGLLRPAAGRIVYLGEELTGRSHLAYRRRGLAYLPAARLERGLVPGMSLAEHFALSEGARGLVRARARGDRLALERIDAYHIKGSPATAVEELSGGNQQRMLLALLPPRLSLILLEHPTRGLDVESSLYVWSLLEARCAEGAAIIFLSSDLEEIVAHSSRLLVFYSGRVSPALETQRESVENLGRLIGGKGWEDWAPGPERSQPKGLIDA